MEAEREERIGHVSDLRLLHHGLVDTRDGLSPECLLSAVLLANGAAGKMDRHRDDFRFHGLSRFLRGVGAVFGGLRLLKHVWANNSQVHQAGVRNAVASPLRYGLVCYLAYLGHFRRSAQVIDYLV
jgi:hypothetical protein